LRGSRGEGKGHLQYKFEKRFIVFIRSERCFLVSPLAGMLREVEG
jgi:hypothetical protein